MKNQGLSLFLLAAVSSVWGQCDPVIDPHQSIRVAQAKLDCFATENAKLKEELAHNNNTTPPRILISPSEYFDVNAFPIEKCLTKAVRAVTTRKGRIIDQGDDWLHATIGADIVLIWCITSGTSTVVDGKTIGLMTRGQIVTVGADERETTDLGRVLVKEIFP